MISVATQLIKGKLSAVLLGPSGVGVLSQLKYLAGLLELLFGLGVYNGLIQQIARANAEQNREAVKQQISSLVLLVAAVGSLGTACAAIISPVLSGLLFGGDKSLAPYVLIVLVSVPASVLARAYKAVLNAFREVRAIVISQMVADIGSVLVFAVLAISFSTAGAVLAFTIYQLTRVSMNVWLACRAIGNQVALPAIGQVRLSALRGNIAFSLLSLFVSPLNIFTTLFVSRCIIAELGIGAGGIFSAAWTVSSLYLRVLYESAASYFLPVLAACQNRKEVYDHLDSALRLYIIGIVPVVLTIVAMGEVGITVLFSQKFALAGALLAILTPVDLLRIISETLGLPLLAQQRLFTYVATFTIWAVAYMGCAYAFLLSYGLWGVCVAYAASHVIYMIVQVAALKLSIGYFPDTRALRPVALCVALAVTTSALTLLSTSIAERCVIAGVTLLAWFLCARRTHEAGLIWRGVKKRFRLERAR